MRTSVLHRLWPMAALLTTLLVAFACGPAAAPTPTKAPAVQATPTPTKAAAPAPTTAAAPKRGGQVVMAMSAEPNGFHPNNNFSYGGDLPTHGTMYNSLMRFDENGVPQPDLAASWEVLDGGTRLVLHLAPNIKFSDGSPLTSEDVVWSINMIMGKVEGHARSGRTGVLDQYIVSMQANDPQTVTINLNRAAPAVIAAWLPQDYAGISKKGTTADQFKKEGYGAGAFKLQSRVTGSHVIVEKNPYYFKAGLPYLDSIKLQVITDATAIWTAVATNKVDFYKATSQVPPPDLYDTLGKTKGLRFIHRPLHNTSRIEFNMTKNYVGPFNDPRVREAVDLVVDRQGYDEVTNYGRGKPMLIWPADWPVWGRSMAEVLAFPGRDPAKKPQDIAKAKQLMADAGYPNGFDTPFDATSTSAGLEWMLLELAKIGIRGKVKITATAEWDNYLIAHKQTITAGSGGWGTSSDPDEMLMAYLMTDGARNVTGYGNPEVDKLIQQQSAELDVAKRVQLVRQVEDIVFLQDRPWAQLVSGFRYYGIWEYVKGREPGFNLYNDNRMD
ncbi:MAG: ABC transporter substrate-binding protein, partial [Chloroflexi bacterium]|nr:ABC transporter substrate-binding protein [Chloroflexota bacterium]